MQLTKGWAVSAGLFALVVIAGGTTFAVAGNDASSVVCQGQNLTFSADGGAPGVTSNQFPAGTQLKITNLDNNKSTTVPVTGVSGSCALLNAAAMEQVREPGKNVIRRNRVERVSGGAAAPAPTPSSGACQGQALTFSAEGGAPGVTSNKFPVGTRLKITNLDNNKSTTVPVTGVSGSCALLNNAAMEQIREPGKNLIRRNRVERVSGGAAAPAPTPSSGACQGQALTFSAEGGAPGVTSNKFPVGTRLKITNLDNNKSTTVPVTGVSGSCALLNNAAMEQIREPGKNLIRRNKVEVVGSAAPAPAPVPAPGQPAGQVVCAGSTVTLSGEGGAPGASSNQFPIGTKLKVTNLDNNKSTTVSVTGVSGSCTLLNNAAFEQVREPGKFLIRRARIEKVG